LAVVCRADVIAHLRAVHNHVVDVLPPQHMSDAEKWQSVNGAPQVVASSCDDVTRHETEEIADVESYVTVENVAVLNSVINGGVPDVLYVIEETHEPVVNLDNFETSCYQTTTTMAPTKMDAVAATRFEDGILYQRCTKLISSPKVESESGQDALRFDECGSDNTCDASSSQRHTVANRPSSLAVVQQDVENSVNGDLHKTSGMTLPIEKTSHDRNFVVNQTPGVVEHNLVAADMSLPVPDACAGNDSYREAFNDDIQCELAVIEISEDNSYIA